MDDKLTVRLIEGGCHKDVRGKLRFVNDFNMSQVKRFYTISNSIEQPKRGWIMHKRETKWFFPLRGITTIHVTGSNTCSELKESTYVLNAEEPKILEVFPGNWFLIEQNGSAEVQVFSNSFVGEFPDDDFRRDQ